jgi:hypothetical protein
MSVTLYSASVPLFTSMLSNLDHLLAKGEVFAAAKKIDPVALTQYRLSPDMLPFTRQVLIACDSAKNGAARMAGIESPKFEDNEVTFADLRARVQKTLGFLATITPAHLDGREDAQVVWPTGRDTSMTLSAHQALNGMALPNFFFHITMVYAILRHNGVEVGKKDYLMGAANKAAIS